MVEVNSPECRIVDMSSHNGIYVNGTKLLSADLHDGDKIRAGHTTFQNCPFVPLILCRRQRIVCCFSR